MAKPSTLKDMLIHVAAVITMVAGFVLFFFFGYLPSATNHGETVTVPDIKGMQLEELEEYVVERGLRYEVNDSAYSDEHPPLTVLKQFPKPGAKVKENRKIIISVNRVKPPTVPMPDLIDRPLKNAQVVLKSNELKIGSTKYVPDLAFNAVINMFYNGKPIKMGTKIPKGSTIDLEIGNGHGNRDLSKAYSDLKGMDFDEARFYLTGIGLVVRNVKTLGDTTEISGQIYKQYPSPNSNIRVGANVDLWVVPKYDSTRYDYYEDQFHKLDSLQREN